MMVLFESVPVFLIASLSFLICACNLCISAEGLAATKLEAFFKIIEPNSKNKSSKGLMFCLYNLPEFLSKALILSAASLLPTSFAKLLKFW